MKRFTLKTKSRGRLETVTFTVDDEDAALIRAHVWSAHWDANGRTWRIYRTDLPRGDGDLHRIIARPGEDEVVCHAFDDCLDFRRASLVILSREQFAQSSTRAGRRAQGMAA